VKILVLGAEGMLGKDLMDTLRFKYPVLGMDIGEVDICARRAVMDEVRRIQPTVVINAAAYTDVDGSESHRETAFAVNADGARNVAVACASVGARMIHLSTDYVFDGSSPEPYREEDPPGPLNIYGSSKLAGERHIQEELKDFLIVRTAWLYGHHGKNFVKAILQQAGLKKELCIVNDQKGSPTFTQDLSRAILRLIEVGATGVVHVTNAEICTWLDFAREILREKGLKGISVTPISSAELNRPARRPPNSSLNCSLYSALTGGKMRPWREAIGDYLNPSIPSAILSRIL
jgi:dTDP-4-dehydrorhamnose reductase